jgi:hypothetical protein
LAAKRIKYVLRKPAATTARHLRKTFTVQKVTNHGGWQERERVSTTEIEKIIGAYKGGHMSLEDADGALKMIIATLQGQEDAKGNGASSLDLNGSVASALFAMAYLNSDAPPVNDFGPGPVCMKTWEYAQWVFANQSVKDPKITAYYIYRMAKPKFHQCNFRTDEYRTFLKSIKYRMKKW